MERLWKELCVGLCRVNGPTRPPETSTCGKPLLTSERRGQDSSCHQKQWKFGAMEEACPAGADVQMGIRGLGREEESTQNSPSCLSVSCQWPNPTWSQGTGEPGHSPQRSQKTAEWSTGMQNLQHKPIAHGDPGLCTSPGKTGKGSVERAFEHSLLSRHCQLWIPRDLGAKSVSTRAMTPCLLSLTPLRGDGWRIGGVLPYGALPAHNLSTKSFVWGKWSPVHNT